MDYTDRGTLQQLFVDSLPDCALILLDVDGKVLSWNVGARTMLGYSEAEIVGRHFSCLYMKEDVDAAKPLMALAKALADGRHDETGRRVRKDGTGVDTQNVLIPLCDPQKKVVAFGSMTRTAGPFAAVSKPMDVSTPAVGARKKVLLLDDDDAVRGAAADMLSSLGYEVFATSNGVEALALLARVRDIDLLFTDVVMPGGMNGGEVAERARQLQPDLRVLFASGYFEGALVRKGNIEASAQFLVKPYRKKELAQKVEEVLGEKSLAH